MLNIEFVAKIGQRLGFNQTATTICFEKQDDATDIQEEDHGFGIMFAWYLQGGCSDATKLSVWLFASHLSSLNPPTWAADGTDLSILNSGSLYVGNETDFDTTYRLSLSEAATLTIPPY